MYNRIIALTTLFLGMISAAESVSLRDITDKVDLEFMQACIKGKKSRIRTLIEAGFDLRSDVGGRGVLKVCQYRNLSLLKYMIKKGAMVNTRTKDGVSLLHMACQRGDAKIAQYLLDSGAEKDSTDRYGRTPLYYACLEGREEVVALFLEIGCVTIIEFTVACEEGHEAIVKQFIAAGILLESTQEEQSKVLATAIQKNWDHIVKLLLSAHVDPNYLIMGSISPLHGAITRGNEKIVQLLLDANADPNLIDQAGMSHLLLASHKGYTAIARLLVAAGAHNAASGYSPIVPLAAAQEGGHEEIVKLLSQKKCAACSSTEKGLGQCSGCKKVYYCSPACQKQDWPQHKKVCAVFQTTQTT